MSSASSESPHWLQLVQAARDADEQNLEAYVKDGQLFFRVLTTVKRDSELLAWYKKDLSQILNLISTESKGRIRHKKKHCRYCKDNVDFEMLYYCIHLYYQKIFCLKLNMCIHLAFSVISNYIGNSTASDEFI